MLVQSRNLTQLVGICILLVMIFGYGITFTSSNFLSLRAHLVQVYSHVKIIRMRTHVQMQGYGVDKMATRCSALSICLF